MPSSEVFDKFKAGTLMSGGGDKPVRDRNQAIAIFMSEKRNEAAHGGVYKEGRKRKSRNATGPNGPAGSASKPFFGRY
jgi:uncharacterized protein DUF6496